MRDDIDATLAAIRTDHEHGASFLTMMGARLIERIAGSVATGSSSAVDALATLTAACRGIALARPSMTALVGLACRVGSVVRSGAPEEALQQALAVARGYSTLRASSTWRRCLARASIWMLVSSR